MAYRIVPIGREVADLVRTRRQAPGYGHPASVETATGTGPCRQCLRLFRIGQEKRILFTYNASPDGPAIPQPGPVFIHEAPCPSFDAEGIPPDLHELPLFLEGFGAGTWRVRRLPVEPGRLDAAIRALLDDDAIAHITIRNAEAGCFVARVERR